MQATQITAEILPPCVKQLTPDRGTELVWSATIAPSFARREREGETLQSNRLAGIWIYRNFHNDPEAANKRT